MKLNFKAILDTKGYNEDSVELFVSNQPVWDFKVLNNELRLIHEPVPGSNTYGVVTVGELKSHLTVQETECPIVSETENREIIEVQGVKSKDKLGINFVLEGNGSTV